ncbi:sensor histidine kinase [Spirillospora albida]|uniref:sensor histidine kinase n=1 Tax=Spirillospora albida TaxID=58123 RepID=UPI000690F19D|nr:sensor histidine kinase [Spirillospora albida]
MIDDLLALEIAAEDDVFAFRQAGRRVAAEIGFEQPDQVRVATALSEAGRELLAWSGRVEVAFLVGRGARPALIVELLCAPRADGLPSSEGYRAASRLMDVVHEERGDRLLVRLRKELPGGAPVDRNALERLRERLRHLRPVSALDELRTQNAELLMALEDIRRQREELQSLNTELEQTNRGVMALYSELSEELEQTNRGVVALYAELEEKSDQLREAAEARNRFWANVSHELRTPVNSVIGLVRLLLDPHAEALTGEQRHQIVLIGESGQTLLSLVNELLDLAKAERGGLEPRPAPVEVPALLRLLADLLGPMAKEAGAVLAVDAAHAPPVLVTDEVMLTRVLRNLVGNALKFTPGGRVSVTARAVPDAVEFVVSDTGAGIPPADIDRVFEEFYQVPGTAAGGTGLGLPYARRLARALGGDLVLDSVLGEGTTVTVRIPPDPRGGGADPAGG